MKFREQIPGALRHRFDSLGGFVNGVLDQKRGEGRRLPKDRREFIQIVIFITVLHRFLIQGARAAQDTLDELKEHGITSFAIGSARFEEGSEDLQRGFVLASELLGAIKNPAVRGWVLSNKTLTTIIEELERNARRP